MPSTVLGKRTRSSPVLDPAALTTRSNKRVDVLEDSHDSEKHTRKRRKHGSADHEDDRMEEDKFDGVDARTFQPRTTQSNDLGKSKAESFTISQTTPSEAQDENLPESIPTPQTPRHRDALSKHPTTPRHRVLLGGKPLTPRSPRTPSTPSNGSRSIYTEARKLFTRGASPTTIIGRDNEREELSNFISTRVDARKGGSVYVSGPPGTGKSALVTEICSTYKNLSSTKHAYINCMSLRSGTEAFQSLASELDIVAEKGKAIQDTLKAQVLNRKGSISYLVILDEIDALLSLDSSSLCTLFEWALAPSSKLILVGIANALDLTDRFLPKLKARNLKPDLLPFLPYTAPQIASVLTARCRSLLPLNTTAPADFVPFIHPTAVQLIAKKVASQSGDLRKSFDLAQWVIDLVESETREKLYKSTNAESSPIRSPLSDNLNLSSPSPVKRPIQSDPASLANLASLTAEVAPRATLPHVVRITSTAFNNNAVSRLKTLNLQQKAVLCSLVALETRKKTPPADTLSPPLTPQKIGGKRKMSSAMIAAFASPVSTASPAQTGAAPTIRALSNAYNILCQRDNVLHALSSTEVRDVVAGLEMASLLSCVDGKGGSLAMPGTPSKKGRGGEFRFVASADDRKITANVGLRDLEAALEGPGAGVLKGILSGECLDG